MNTVKMAWTPSFPDPDQLECYHMLALLPGQGGTIIATEPPAGPTVTPRLHRRGPVVNLELNSINVFPTGVAIVSGPDQSALVKPFGTLTDLGDAQVSVSSGGFAAVSTVERGRLGLASLSQSSVA